MTSIIIADLGHGPTNETCAQLGQTPDFEAHNRLELEVFAAAILARNGPLPKGMSFAHQANHHDFGTYWTLALKNDPDQYPKDLAYIVADRLQIPETWIANGFRAPVDYGDPKAPVARTFAECIASALAVTRPATDGSFWPLENGILHNHLKTAFPDTTIPA